MKILKYLTGLLAIAVSSTMATAQTDIFPDFHGTITSPAISPDGNRMVFLGEISGKKKSDEQEQSYQLQGSTVYESVRSGDHWGNPKQIEVLNDIMLKSGKNVGGFSFNYNGRQLLFHAFIDGSYDIMYVTLNNGVWQNPVRLDEPVNSPVDEFSPSLTVNNDYIFLLRPKKETKSDVVCKEIVLYHKGNDGRWTGPQYLPNAMNTGCQETPFFCSDQKTLFFSSMRSDTTSDGKRLPDDVYNVYCMTLRTVNIYDNMWLLPQYVSELSTEYNDLSVCTDNSGSTVLKNISPKKTNKKQPNKIYELPMPMSVKPQPTMLLKGTISDRYTKQPVEEQITVSDAITSAVLGEYQTDADGNYSIFLKEQMNYKIDFWGNGYSHAYHFEKTELFSEHIEKTFDTTIFSTVELELNVYDEEMFNPLAAKISVYDSVDNRLITDSMAQIGYGKFGCQLNIGKTYLFHIDCPHYDHRDIYLNTIADVFYNAFEEDVELKPSRMVMVLDVDAGGNSDSVLVNVKNLSRNETTTVIAKRDKNGNLIVELREGDNYEIDVSKKGYTYSSTKVQVDKSKKTQRLNIKLDLLTKNTKMTFNNITFETNSAELNTASYDELNRLIDFMKLNDNIKIELSAHTDDLGSDAYNFRLSDKRALSAVKYLTDNGVDKKRIVSKGYGESQPIVPNTSDENRAQNRRVEVKILDNINIE